MSIWKIKVDFDLFSKVYKSAEKNHYINPDSQSLSIIWIDASIHD